MSGLHLNIQQKTYPNGVHALAELEFEVAPGQFTAIVGPSGAGKSTLLNIISGLDKDVRGEVKFISTQPPRIGFMFQEARLMPWLSVRQNIELVLEGLSVAEQQAALERIPLLMQQVGLRDFTEVYPGQLSIGMRRRVSLVRAFLIQPDLLLMDEPFQSLDEPTAIQMRELLLQLWRDTSASVLFVTHNLQEALTLAERVIFLSARPAQVVFDLLLDRNEAQLKNRSGIQALHDRLLQAHPQLLSGEVADRKSNSQHSD